MSRPSLTTRLAALRAGLATLGVRVVRHLPVPLAAPESVGLAAARRRVILALLLLALIGLGADALCAWSPLLTAGLVAATLTLLALQTPLWLRAKVRADHEWQMREPGEGERDD